MAQIARKRETHSGSSAASISAARRVAERLEQLRRVRHRREAIGMRLTWPPSRRDVLRREARCAASAGGAPTSSRTDAPAWARCTDRRAACPRAIEHGRRVAHRARDDVLVDEPAVDSRRTSGRERHAPAARLEPEQAAAAAGMRIEPPPSFACAIGTMPAATAAAEPPLEPPVERVRSYGLRVGRPRGRLRRRHDAELARVRLADDNEAGAAQRRDEVAIDRRREPSGAAADARRVAARRRRSR